MWTATARASIFRINNKDDAWEAPFGEHRKVGTMQSALATQLEPRGNFRTWPAENVVRDFLEHVRVTGQPDLWEHHTASRPPADQDFIVLREFGIPEERRAEVGKATCPICSPSSGKYFHGALAWFPREGVVRAIGIECAKGHFGQDRFQRARDEGERHRAIQRAQDTLLDLLPRLPELREAVDALLPICVAADRFRDHFVTAVSASAAKALAKQGQGGELIIEEMVTVDVADRYGVDRKSRTSREVGRLKVQGMSLLSSTASAAAAARNASAALDAVQAVTPEEALEVVTTKLADPVDLFQAETVARRMHDEVQKVWKLVCEARAFVTMANLLALDQWANHHLVSPPFEMSFDPRYAARITVRKRFEKERIVPIPSELIGPLPEAISVFPE